jgi:hypothetical protein
MPDANELLRMNLHEVFSMLGSNPPTAGLIPQ